jgi:adenylate cyclase class 2
MKYEVEQKFPVDDLADVQSRLIELGAAISPPQEEWDLYFVHPVRDFARTDEALRIRRKKDFYAITYKGPKIDQTTKTRREIELPLGDTAEVALQWVELLKALGFSPLAEVRKSRRKAWVKWDNRQVEVSLDRVEQLGAFVELELVVEPAELEAARAVVASLAERLGLRNSERRSYLELLLAVRPAHGRNES